MKSSRIVSLVPSLTQTVCGFGLRSSLVGCTNFCIDPVGLQRTAKLVGGTKDPDIQEIRKLEPTHILVNEEENTPQVIEACKQIASTFVSFPKDPHEVPAMLRDLGAFLGVPEVGLKHADDCVERFADLAELVGEKLAAGSWLPKKYIYLIWRNPWMTVSKDTYISSMLSLVAFENVAPPGTRYPALSAEQIVECGPDLLLLSSEPFPFRERDCIALYGEMGACMDKAIATSPLPFKADGKLFSWYGLVLIEALEKMIQWVEARPQDLIRPMGNKLTSLD